jgi:hypothetical protein
MPRRRNAEKVLARLIDETFRSYLAAVKNRTFLLEMSHTGLLAGRWNENAQKALRFGAILSRVCGGISQELQNLYALEERVRKGSGKDFRLVIEHVESPWRPEYAQGAAVDNGTPPELQPPDAEQSEP